MCGRTACNLSPEVICRACSYEDPNVESNRRSKYKKPAWRQHPPTKDKKDPQKFHYKRSVNVPPTRFTPVMIKRAEESSTRASDREIMPMMFGMIPFFHKGEAKSHGYRTHNCRLEGVMESKLFRRSWKKRRFCVVLVQGFYKWKEVNKDLPDQPYLIYMSQNSTKDLEAKVPMIADNSVWEKSKWSETKGWEGPKIMKLAGMYDVWKHATTGEEIYSYTLFTMKANATLSWLHDRMPVIFRTEDQVQAWLNATEETADKEILNILKPATDLKWYRVDPKVGNARCQDLDCVCPVQAQKKGTEKMKGSKGSSKKGSKGTGKRKGSKAKKKGSKGTGKRKGSKGSSKKGSKCTRKRKGSKAKKKGSKGTGKRKGSKGSSKKGSKGTRKRKGSKAQKKASKSKGTRKRKGSKGSSNKGCTKRAKK